MSASTALVSYATATTIRYQDGATEVADLPRDTLDPRYPSCTAGQHHTACVCREAELAEMINEMRGELAHAFAGSPS